MKYRVALWEDVGEGKKKDKKPETEVQLNP